MTCRHSLCLNLLRLLCFICNFCVATSALSCNIILSDPVDGQRDVAVNHNIVLIVEKNFSESCPIKITTSDGKSVIPVTVLYSSPVVKEKDVSRQIVVARPKSLLWSPGGNYVVSVSAKSSVISFSADKSAHDIEGRLSSVVDNPIQFSPWRNRKFIAASDINDSLGVFLDLKLGQDPGPRIKEFLSKQLHVSFPNFSSAKSRYGVRIGKIYFYSFIPGGRKEKFSALLVYPVAEKLDYKKSGIVLFDTRSRSHYQPSSADNYISWLGSVIASKGYVFVSPDAWDNMSSDISADAYPFYYAKKNIDLVEATREFFLNTYSSDLKDKSILVGSFDGGRDVIDTLLLSSILSYRMPSIVMSDSSAYDLSSYFSPILSCSDSYSRNIPKDLLSNLSYIVYSYSHYWDLYSYLGNIFSLEKGLIFNEPRLCKQFSDYLQLMSPSHQSWTMHANGTEVYLYQHPLDDTLPANNSLELSSSLMNGGKFKFITHSPCDKKSFSAIMRSGAVTSHSACGFFMFDDLLHLLSTGNA